MQVDTKVKAAGVNATRTKGTAEPAAGAAPITDAVGPGRPSAPKSTAPTDKTSGPEANWPIRDSAWAVNYVHTFNGNLHLAPADLAQKIVMMKSGALKFLRCMPGLYGMDMVHGPFKAMFDAIGNGKPPEVENCGDFHMGNVGTYAGKDKNSAVFGYNDFDMALRNSPAYDLVRMATSVILGMTASKLLPTLPNGDPDPAAAAKVISHLTKSYLGQVGKIANGHGAGPGYLTKDDDVNGAIKQLIHKKAKVERHDWIKKYANPDGKGGWSFIDGATDKAETGEEGKLTPITDLNERKELLDAVEHWESQAADTPNIQRPLKILDVCHRKESGGSSYGQPRYYVLVASAEEGKPPHILEIKQELPGPTDKSCGNLHHADANTVVEGYKAMKCAPGHVLGSTTIGGISCLVRERDPQKASLEDDAFQTADDYKDFLDQVAVCAARGQTQPLDKDKKPEDVAKSILAWAGDPDKFNQQITNIGLAYAKQTTNDWQAFSAAN